MTRWEYCHIIVRRRDGTPPSYSDHAHPEDVDAILNKYGQDGWEVWQLDGSLLRLRREIFTELPDFG